MASVTKKRRKKRVSPQANRPERTQRAIARGSFRESEVALVALCLAAALCALAILLGFAVLLRPQHASSEKVIGLMEHAVTRSLLAVPCVLLLFGRWHGSRHLVTASQQNLLRLPTLITKGLSRVEPADSDRSRRQTPMVRQRRTASQRLSQPA